MRRGAVRLIGVSAAKVEPNVERDWKKLLERWPELPKLQQPLERSKVAIRFEQLKGEERLYELRDNDADPTVRQAARITLERLAMVRESSIRGR
jgi:hypothetical protein